MVIAVTIPVLTLCNTVEIAPQLNIVVQSLSHIQLFAIPWTGAHQASLTFTIS